MAPVGAEVDVAQDHEVHPPPLRFVRIHVPKHVPADEAEMT